MTATLPPVSVTEPRLAKAESAAAPASAEVAKKTAASGAPAQQPAQDSDKHQVHFDHQAARFVHTLTDADSQKTIWSYPNEAQLAYARAVMAYVRALTSR
jgi:hypothetical protein